jgi:hypothetical protein
MNFVQASFLQSGPSDCVMQEASIDRLGHADSSAPSGDDQALVEFTHLRVSKAQWPEPTERRVSAHGGAYVPSRSCPRCGHFTLAVRAQRVFHMEWHSP